MIALWQQLQAHPDLAAATCLAAVSAAWAWRARRLRHHEAETLRLVDEHTRQWQDDRRPPDPPAPPGEPAGDEASPPATTGASGDARVLVVLARREQREALAALLAGFGAQAVFADSPWAAGVATDQADADGRPFDLVLVESSMDAARPDDGAMSARIDAADLARLLAPAAQERHAASGCAGLAILPGERPGLLSQPGTI
jgi:CheY-like chemotaxis protein